MADSKLERYAVVTGANKGLGFAVCKLLPSKGIVVVLTARDEKRGLESIDKLKIEYGLSDHVIFHQLDVSDPASVSSLVDFVKHKFGKLDILSLESYIPEKHSELMVYDRILLLQYHERFLYVKAEKGMDANALRVSGIGQKQVDWSKIITEKYELTEECLNINYYGAKRMVYAFIGILQLSDSPTIVNVSSSMGKLENLPEGLATEVFSNPKSLTEEKVDELLKEFLNDFKDGSLKSKGWPVHPSAYTVSKAAFNAYTRVIVANYPTFLINCVCPGFVKTDINCNTDFLTPDEGAEGPVSLALLPDGSPSGQFFQGTKEATF